MTYRAGTFQFHGLDAPDAFAYLHTWAAARRRVREQGFIRLAAQVRQTYGDEAAAEVVQACRTLDAAPLLTLAEMREILMSLVPFPPERRR